MYRQHVKSAKTINDNRAVMIGPKRDDGIAISNSFRVNLRIKNFVAPKVTQDVDLVISIYEVNDAEATPKALCENFVVKGWRRNAQQDDLICRDNLRVVFGDIYKVSIDIKFWIKVKGQLLENNYGGGGPIQG